jgi:uncharacterized protein DUF4332
MAVDIVTPVSAIEGIGPATAAALAQVGVWTVLDLVRVRFDVVHGAVRTLASTAEVRSWRRMALLLEVAEMTPQWAEALVKKKVEGIDELFRKRLDEIDALMRQAKEDAVIQDPPTTTQIAEMLKDAAVLCHTGVLVGTVFDSGWHPLPGAVIRVGPGQTKSDAHGHFRVFRIPLGKRTPLQISHPDHAALLVEQPRIATDVGVVGGQTFQLKPRSSETAAPGVLSELDGDVLPATYRRARQVSMAPDALRAGDVLVVREFYSAAPDVQLVSRLKAYRDGDLLVYTVRLPVSRLPSGVQLKDQFRVVNGELVRVEMSPAQLQRLKLRLRLRKAFAGRPRPASDDERRAFVREALSFLTAHGYYRNPRGT